MSNFNIEIDHPATQMAAAIRTRQSELQVSAGTKFVDEIISSINKAITDDPFLGYYTIKDLDDAHACIMATAMPRHGFSLRTAQHYNGLKTFYIYWIGAHDEKSTACSVRAGQLEKKASVIADEVKAVIASINTAIESDPFCNACLHMIKYMSGVVEIANALTAEGFTVETTGSMYRISWSE